MFEIRIILLAFFLVYGPLIVYTLTEIKKNSWVDRCIIEEFQLNYREGIRDYCESKYRTKPKTNIRDMIDEYRRERKK